MKDQASRRDFLRLVGSAAVAGSILPAVAFGDSTSKRPNVLMIVADDLNTALTGYGHPQCKTPNLDRLAARGTTFTRAYCQFPLCGPSRASFMSGRYPLTNGVTGNGDPLPANTTTLPALFRQAGYWTGRVSKIYHMGVPGNIFTGANGTDHPGSWDERYNVSVMETLTPGKAEDLMLVDSTDTYEELRKKWQEARNKGGKFVIPKGNHQGSDFVVVEGDGGDEVFADGVAANKAIELLGERAKADKPFFLAVGFVRPHVPLVAPHDAFTGYDPDAMQLAEQVEGDLKDIPAAAQSNTNARKYKMSPENQKKVLRGYYACISYMDRQVGRLLDELDRLGLADNTIVTFQSDHGYHLGEHTMWQKLSLMEESIRVPLIVAAPGRKGAKKKCDRLVELVDVYPTLAEVAGLAAPPEVQGRSFAKLLDDPSAAAIREDAFVQTGNDFCLRTDKWAYMLYDVGKAAAGPAMLYDMQADPKQYTNLSGNPKYADVEKTLRASLEARIAAAKGKK